MLLRPDARHACRHSSVGCCLRLCLLSLVAAVCWQRVPVCNISNLEVSCCFAAYIKISDKISHSSSVQLSQLPLSMPTGFRFSIDNIRAFKLWCLTSDASQNKREQLEQQGLAAMHALRDVEARFVHPPWNAHLLQDHVQQQCLCWGFKALARAAGRLDLCTPGPLPAAALSLWESSAGADVLLQLRDGGLPINAHAAVLAARCHVLHAAVAAERERVCQVHWVRIALQMLLK